MLTESCRVRDVDPVTFAVYLTIGPEEDQINSPDIQNDVLVFTMTLLQNYYIRLHIQTCF